MRSLSSNLSSLLPGFVFWEIAGLRKLAGIFLMAFMFVLPMQGAAQGQTEFSADAYDSNPLGSRTPLILIHGWCGNQADTWGDFRQFFYEAGNPLNSQFKLYYFNFDSGGNWLPDSLTCPDKNTDHTWTRVRSLAVELEMALENDLDIGSEREISILTHSLGGLIARSFMQELGRYNRTRVLITLATPHHGTIRADDVDPDVFPELTALYWDKYKFDPLRILESPNNSLRCLNGYEPSNGLCLGGDLQTRRQVIPKIVVVGLIDDEVVPIDSALFEDINHDDPTGQLQVRKRYRGATCGFPNHQTIHEFGCLVAEDPSFGRGPEMVFDVIEQELLGVITLQNDVPVTNLSGAQGSQRHFRIAVPAGASSLVVTISGGSGDADLYVRRGQQAAPLASDPTASDCGPYLNGNNEACTFTNPAGGDWYVMLHGYWQYSGVTLRAKYMVGPTCTYSISPTSQSVAASGGSGSVGVSTTPSSGCGWTAVSNASWITVTSGSNGSGSGTVTYSVAANTSTSARTGTLAVAGKVFTVTQAGISCTYSISPTSQSFGSSGGTGTVGVTAPSGCSRTASSNASWITITSGSNGSGNGTVAYSVAVNTSTSARTGTVTIAGKTFTVTQAGASCTYSISPTGQSISSSGGPGSVGVTAPSGCSWTAVSNVSWITITSGSSGNGSGTVNYTVAANTSTSPRSGTLTVAGKTFTVTQAGATSAVTGLQNDVPVSNLSGVQGSQRHFKITVAAGASSLVVTISGGSGDADLYVRRGQQPTLGVYDCSPYLGGNNETCSFTNPASGDWYIMLNSYASYSGVTLRAKYTMGSVCTYSISPTSQSVGSSGGSGSVGVTAPGGCSRTATSNASWITITSGSTGSGSGTVTYSVATNTSTSARTGTLTIAGKTFTVTQAGAASGVTALQNNVPVSGLSGALGSQRYFKIAVPVGRSSLVVTISGGSGDADLYVRRGQQPTLSVYDCSPYIGGNNETCSFTNPASGDWYIMLRGYSSYSGVTLRAKY